MAYIGHFYFCTVLDAALVSGKLILALLDGTSVAPTSRSAIANGSARAITIIQSVVLDTAGGPLTCALPPMITSPVPFAPPPMPAPPPYS